MTSPLVSSPPDIWNSLAIALREASANEPSWRMASYAFLRRDALPALEKIGYSKRWLVPCPKDLRSLAMTCRTLYRHYLPEMYRHFQVDVDRIEGLPATLRNGALCNNFWSLAFEDWSFYHRIRVDHNHIDQSRGLDEISESVTSMVLTECSLAASAPNLVALQIAPIRDVPLDFQPLHLPFLDYLEIERVKGIRTDLDTESDHVCPDEAALQRMFSSETQPRTLFIRGMIITATSLQQMTLLGRVEWLSLRYTRPIQESVSVGRLLGFTSALTFLYLMLNPTEWSDLLRWRPDTWPQVIQSGLRTLIVRRNDPAFEKYGLWEGAPDDVEEVFADDPPQSPTLLSSFSSFEALERLELPMFSPMAVGNGDPLPPNLKKFILGLPPWGHDIRCKLPHVIEVDAMIILCCHVFDYLETCMREARCPHLEEIQVGEVVTQTYWALQHSLTFPDGRSVMARYDRFRYFCNAHGVLLTVEDGQTFGQYWTELNQVECCGARDCLNCDEKIKAAKKKDPTVPPPPSKSLVYRYKQMERYGERNNRSAESPPTSGTDDW